MTSVPMPLLIFHYARDGLTRVLCGALNDLDPTAVKQMISQEVVNLQGERMTPLMAAVKQGHQKVVKLLIERFGADVNYSGAIRIDNALIDGASPLWVAAGSGHINIVKNLIEAGATINHRTETGSTPIRAACFDGKLEIVRYLAHCGADIEIPNRYDNTCLMIASYRGHGETVSFLLERGADPNKQARCGATALHFAAEFGQIQIIECLLRAGAIITNTNAGFSPMMLAAEQARDSVVELFINRADVVLTKREIIDAIELLGASFANDQKSYNLEFCLKYLRLGMQMRFADLEDIIPKPMCDPVPAYGNRIECRTLEELNAIAGDEDALHMESLTIRYLPKNEIVMDPLRGSSPKPGERLLGPALTNEVTIPILYRGAMMAEEGRFERCIELWMHRLNKLLARDACVSKDIHRFSTMFSRILLQHHKLRLVDVIAVLQAAHVDLMHMETLLGSCEVQYDQRKMEEERDVLIYSIIELMIIATTIVDETTEMVRPSLYKTVYEILLLDAHTAAGQSFLHLATSPNTRVNEILFSLGLKFPNEPVASMLIDCGADVNESDRNKNTPLHLVVSPYRASIRGVSTIQAIIQKLVERGAHLDAVNRDGKTPFQKCHSLYIQIILKGFCKVPDLRCLAARSICDHELPVPEYLPTGLKDFIRMHGRD